MPGESNSDQPSELQSTNSDHFKDRLFIAMQGASTNSFAKKCGIGESTFRKYLAGSIPSLDKASNIAKEAGVHLQWLATGEGEQWITYATGAGKTGSSVSLAIELLKKNGCASDYSEIEDEDLQGLQPFPLDQELLKFVIDNTDPNKAVDEEWAEELIRMLSIDDFNHRVIRTTLRLYEYLKSESGAVSSEFAMIPGYNVEVAAGDGAFPEQEEATRKLAFRHKWLKYRGLKPEDLVLVFAKGDSMEPTISDNNTLMIDTSQRELNDGQIYVIRTDGHLIVKRIQKLWNKGILLLSDNKEYKEQQVEPNEADDLEVIGRVVWIGKDV